MTSSYTDSMCVLLSLLFVSCRLRAALIFVLLLIKVTTITIMKTTMLTIKAVAREPLDIMHPILASSMLRFSVGCRISVFTLIGLLILPEILAHESRMVCTANVHILLFSGTSVQVVVVWLVLAEQLPQFDARML